MEWILFIGGAWALILLAYLIGLAQGHRAGVRGGFTKYANQLRFERRNIVSIAPTDQPHSRRPKGRARVTDAHMSQVRRYWSAD